MPDWIEMVVTLQVARLTALPDCPDWSLCQAARSEPSPDWNVSWSFLLHGSFSLVVSWSVFVPYGIAEAASTRLFLGYMHTNIVFALRRVSAQAEDFSTCAACR